mgnify:CR=1 FL=1
MIIVFKQNATVEEKAKLKNQLESKGFQIHASDGVNASLFGVVGDTSALDIRMARVNYYRQMAELFHSGNCAYIKCIARICFKGADTAFAKDNVFVALAHDIFRCHQPFLNRRCQATLQQNRLIRLEADRSCRLSPVPVL